LAHAPRSLFIEHINGSGVQIVCSPGGVLAAGGAGRTLVVMTGHRSTGAGAQVFDYWIRSRDRFLCADAWSGGGRDSPACQSRTSRNQEWKQQAFGLHSVGNSRVGFVILYHGTARVLLSRRKRAASN